MSGSKSRGTRREILQDVRAVNRSKERQDLPAGLILCSTEQIRELKMNLFAYFCGQAKYRYLRHPMSSDHLFNR
jgi:hypothetical protein